MQNINLPEQVNYIIDQLTSHGFEAYAVGGCVRDIILGKEPIDWDITTSASPEETKTIFRRTVDTGIQHGTVMVMIDKIGYEVTTYRIDGTYEDGRHPNSVTFTKTLKEDLKRRDFTINAMAYNEISGLIDEFGGMDDLSQHIIRCVGEPTERFKEDALRILRAFRFSAQLGFKIDSNTLLAASAQADQLIQISSERIREELSKLLISSFPEKLKDVYLAGITRIVLPEFDFIMKQPMPGANADQSVGEFVLNLMNKIKKEFSLRFALLFHLYNPVNAQSSARQSEAILRRLHCDNKTILLVKRLISNQHFYEEMLTQIGMRKTIHRIGLDLMDSLFLLWECIYPSQNQDLKKAHEQYMTILSNQDCLDLRSLAVNGSDLIAFGFPKDPRIGFELERLLNLVLEHPDWNTKEILLQKCSK